MVGSYKIEADLSEKNSLRNKLYFLVKKHKKVLIKLERAVDFHMQEDINKKNKMLIDEIIYLNKFDLITYEFLISDSAYKLILKNKKEKKK